jgi:O-antigen/teichoic acid export membrane protein
MIRFALLFAGSAAVLKLFGFLLSLWIARALIPEQYGIWGIAFAIQVGIGTFGMVGIQESLVGLLKEHPSQMARQHLYAASMGAYITTLAITLVVSLCVIFVALGLKSIGAIGYAGVIISGSLTALTTLQAQIARLEEDHMSSLTFSFLIPLAGVAGSAIAFKVIPSVDAFFAGSGLGMLVVTAILYRRLRGLTLPTREVTVTRSKLLRRLTPFVLVAFLGWLSGYGSNLFVNHLFGLKDVAKLTFLLTIGSVLQLLTTALNQVWAPRFYSLIHSKQDKEAIERLNHRFYSIQGFGLGAFAAICVAGMPYLLDYAGGQLTSYRHMQGEMLLIFIGYIILVPWTHCQNYLLVYDKGKTLMYVVLLSSIIGLTVWLTLMTLLGAIGIYLGFFFQMMLRSIGISISVRQWPVRLSWGATVGGILLASSGLLFPTV